MGCQDCKFNAGPMPHGYIKCTSLKKIREIDGQLLQDRFENFYRKMGYVALFNKKECSCCE
ncbi:MAG: hypothetical protein PHQ43_13605 [Dehalococcoidales bacterium]|nr:hypothetical protein [Dehalococcoidales bacterium]